MPVSPPASTSLATELPPKKPPLALWQLMDYNKKGLKE